MEKKQQYEQLEQLLVEMGSMRQTLDYVNDVLKRLMEENRQLAIENDHLRELMAMHGTEKLTDGLSNLEKLYESGVHICHNFYGASRQDMCLLCESLLSQQHD